VKKLKKQHQPHQEIGLRDHVRKGLVRKVTVVHKVIVRSVVPRVVGFNAVASSANSVLTPA